MHPAWPTNVNTTGWSVSTLITLVACSLALYYFVSLVLKDKHNGFKGACFNEDDMKNHVCMGEEPRWTLG